MNLFLNDTQTVAKGDGAYTATLTNNWSIGDTPNGGYSMAILANAMRDFSDFNAPVAMSANYCGRLKEGDLDLKVERLSQSRQFDRLQINAEQDGVIALRAWGTLMQSYQDDPHHEQPAPKLPPLDQCLALDAAPGMNIHKRFDIRFDPDTAGWTQQQPSERSEMRGWLTLAEPQDVGQSKPQPASQLTSEPTPQLWTPELMMLVCDTFPPSIFSSRGMFGWVPTIELNVQILKLPTSKWLKCVFRSSFINGNLLVEDGEIWDADDDLVATCRQLAQFKVA